MIHLLTKFCYSSSLLLILVWTNCAISQEKPAPPSQSQPDDLTKDLLNLLTEPAPNPNSTSGPSNPKPNASPNASPGPTLDRDGEDIGDLSHNPLGAVRRDMLAAAKNLERGEIEPTQRLQAGIVQQMDDLIKQLEQQQNQKKPAQNQSQRQQKSQTQQTQIQKQPRPSETTTEDEANRDSTNTDQDNSPGQRGSPNSATVELADLKALQQNVWGQLPERVRQQMQSRMVEQFLPSYREQIEAYFRALMK